MPDATPPAWWQTGLIYQIYPRSFRDATGDGVGDLPGITERLPYLSETLGVDAVWLSPFYPSPMADFGYDVTDYTDVHPLFGTLQDFDRLLAEAHRQGLRVLIDFVPNHTSDQHPWFVAARSARTSPQRDWYIWRDAAPDGGPPNNWLSAFGGGAWTWDEGTGQYYLHSYLKEQPDLNWRNPEVVAAMLDVLRFWLDRGVDGFRIDAAHRLLKDPLLRDNPLNPDPEGARWRQGRLFLYEDYDQQLHLHDMKHPDRHALYRAFRQLLDGYGPERPRVAVGEVAPAPWEEWIAYYGAASDEFHLPLNFEFIRAPWEAGTIRALVDGFEAALPPGAWPNYVLGSHDVPRLASRLGPAGARTAALLLLTLRGTPTLYYGDEIGMTDVPIAPDRHQDPFGRRFPDKSRDPCRTPMQWNDGPHAGFSEPDAAAPWLPLAADYRTVNVERQLQEAGSLLNLYRRLIALRRTRPALHLGRYRALGGAPDDLFVYLREAGADRMLVALNFADAPRTLALSDPSAARIALSTDPDRAGPADLTAFRLQPHEGVLFDLT